MGRIGSHKRFSKGNFQKKVTLQGDSIPLPNLPANCWLGRMGWGIGRNGKGEDESTGKVRRSPGGVSQLAAGARSDEFIFKKDHETRGS